MALGKYHMPIRKLCPCCKVKPVAISYRKYGRAYYRNRCDQCYRKKKKPAPPAWLKSGYKKKERCEKCGFKFKLHEQSKVYHIDGDVENCDWVNLKTICANCEIEILHGNLPWKPSSLVPDF